MNITKNIGILLAALLICCSATFSQQNVGFRANIVSPVVNPEGTVTFKLKAPLAKYVNVRGDWEVNGGVGQMTKDVSGIWNYTTTKLPSDLYFYSFEIDSIRIVDPSNAFSYRDVGNLFSLFIVNNGNGDNYSVNNVPHGNVSSI